MFVSLLKIIIFSSCLTLYTSPEQIAEALEYTLRNYVRVSKFKFKLCWPEWQRKKIVCVSLFFNV